MMGYGLSRSFLAFSGAHCFQLMPTSLNAQAMPDVLSQHTSEAAMIAFLGRWLVTNPPAEPGAFNCEPLKAAWRGR
jgi:hypothetical protein